MKGYCAFRDKSPRGEAASWECVISRYGRGMLQLHQGCWPPSRVSAAPVVTLPNGDVVFPSAQIVRAGFLPLVKPDGKMYSSASTLAAERRRVDRKRNHGSLAEKDAL